MTTRAETSNSTHQTHTTAPDLDTLYTPDDYQTITLDSSHPLYLHPSDHPGQILVSTLLNVDNFNEWKRSISLALSTKISSA